MAGFFNFFNYDKEGPGIAKDAPKKKAFVVFFETYFRNFWRFITINATYSIIFSFVLTNGLANAGIDNVTRNIARDKHSFGISDFFDTIKSNWKQSLIAGIINAIVLPLMIFAIMFYYSVETTVGIIGFALCLCTLFIWLIMHFYIWNLIITFKLGLKQIYKNSFKFVFINMGGNLICSITLLVIYALYVFIAYIFQSHLFFVLMVEILVAMLTLPSFRFLLIQFCTFPSIKKLMIDPYYEAHPDEDIEQRRSLGLEVDEKYNKNYDDNSYDEESVDEDI